MLAQQLEFFLSRIVPVDQRPPLFKGYLRCDCDLVFWQWPIGTGLPPTRCTGQTGAPDLRRFHLWTCWRKINRCNPTSTPRPMPTGLRDD